MASLISMLKDSKMILAAFNSGVGKCLYFVGGAENTVLVYRWCRNRLHVDQKIPYPARVAVPCQVYHGFCLMLCICTSLSLCTHLFTIGWSSITVRTKKPTNRVAPLRRLQTLTLYDFCITNHMTTTQLENSTLEAQFIVSQTLTFFSSGDL